MKIAFRLQRQLFVDILHSANDITGVPQHRHNQNGDEEGQPVSLTNLFSDTFAAAGAVELRNGWRQCKQKTMAE